MAAPRTLPRHEGMLLLHNEQTLSKLKIPEDASDAELQHINSTLYSMLASISDAFYVETGRLLEIKPDERAGFYWLVEDIPLNSSQYPWLKSKCLKMEKNLTKRMNQDGIKSSLNSPNHN